MIREATIADSQSLAKALWSTWQGLKARQIANPLDGYPTVELLTDEISRDLRRWLVCESSDPKQIGFFALSAIGQEKRYRRRKFPERSVQIRHFARLLSGEVLLPQFQMLAAHLKHESISVVIDAQLREAYWAALKAGFRLLGECPTIVGTSAWLYLDRHESFEQVQTKLLRARLLVMEPDGPSKVGKRKNASNR
jgi:hypothetical protein